MYTKNKNSTENIPVWKFLKQSTEKYWKRIYKNYIDSFKSADKYIMKHNNYSRNNNKTYDAD